MPDYRRNRVPGGTLFFTVNLRDRRSDLLVAQIDLLRGAVRRVRARAPFPHRCLGRSNKRWARSINSVNAAGLRPQDSAFVGLSNFPSFDRNHAGKERTKMSFGFF